MSTSKLSLSIRLPCHSHSMAPVMVNPVRYFPEPNNTEEAPLWQLPFSRYDIRADAARALSNSAFSITWSIRLIMAITDGSTVLSISLR
jgi:hypothetical protein